MPVWFVLAIVLFLGVAAAALSWHANTLIDMRVVPKILFAIGAFFGNAAYLLHFLIFKTGLYLYVRRMKPKLFYA